MAVFVEPLDRLLNTISHELDEQNLRSLIHICGYYIRGRDREKIKDGLDLFRILRHNGVLSEDRDKIGNLLEILKEMRPKRQDLVDKVTEFIRNTVEAPDTILVIDSESFEASGEIRGLKLVRESRCDTPLLVSSDSRFCSMNCCCWSCNCYSRRCPPCVCVILAGAFLLVAVVATIAWYGDIPRVTDHLNKDEDRKNTGKYAVGLLVFTGLVFVFISARLKGKLDRTTKHYSTLEQPNEVRTAATIQRTYRDSVPSATASMTSLPKSTSRKYPHDGSKASSYASNSTISSSTFPTLSHPPVRSFMSKLPDDVVPDGLRGTTASICSFDSECVFPEGPEAMGNLSDENLTEDAGNHILHNP